MKRARPQFCHPCQQQGRQTPATYQGPLCRWHARPDLYPVAPWQRKAERAAAHAAPENEESVDGV